MPRIRAFSSHDLFGNREEESPNVKRKILRREGKGVDPTYTLTPLRVAPSCRKALSIAPLLLRHEFYELLEKPPSRFLLEAKKGERLNEAVLEVLVSKDKADLIYSFLQKTPHLRERASALAVHYRAQETLSALFGEEEESPFLILSLLKKAVQADSIEMVELLIEVGERGQKEGERMEHYYFFHALWLAAEEGALTVFTMLFSVLEEEIKNSEGDTQKIEDLENKIEGARKKASGEICKFLEEKGYPKQQSRNGLIDKVTHIFKKKSPRTPVEQVLPSKNGLLSHKRQAPPL